jgi:hypothetical protein
MDFKYYPIQIFLTTLAVITSMLYNGFGVAIVKNASGVQSTTIDISRTSLVWLFFLTVPITIQLPN